MTPPSVFLNRLAAEWSVAETNPLTRQLHSLRAAGERIIDLVTPTQKSCGPEFPAERLHRVVDTALRDVASVRFYDPDPMGQRPAREAIAAYYGRRGWTVDPDKIILTPGTSLAYFYLLRLLIQPGDEVLIPSPGYPLFDDLCALVGASIRRYHLRKDFSGRWCIDPDEIAFQCTPRSRMLMLVSPHNPTGAICGNVELEAIASVCRQRNLAVVFDEVFCECLRDGMSFPRPQAGAFPLLFVLNGFSKMFALPGWKAGWIAASGDESLLGRVMGAMERLSDTFLPVNELVQATIPLFFEEGDSGVLDELRRLLSRRMEVLAASLQLQTPLPAAGVYLSGSLAEGEDDEQVALRLLVEERVHVHPGYLYDMAGHLVMTCLAGEDDLRRGGEILGRVLVR